MDSSLLWHEKYVTEDGQISDQDLELVLLEILRLFPPFFGCLRIATEDFDLDDVHVSKGMIRHSNKTSHFRRHFSDTKPGPHKLIAGGVGVVVGES